jgi:hypothetical protein
MSVEYFNIEPINRSTSGVYSYDNGSPVIQFAIGDVEKYLIGQSLRIQFDFTIKNNAGGAVTGTEVGVSSSNGLHSVFQQVDISSYKSNLMLESIRNYNKCVTTLYNAGFCDQEELVDRGTNEGVSPSQQFNNENVGIYNIANQAQSFTLPLYTGLLQSQPVFLGQNALMGLKINLNLAPSSNVLARETGSATYTYELSNVRLIGMYYNPTEDEFVAGRIKSSFISKYEGMMRAQGVNPTSDELETAWSDVQDISQGKSQPPYEYYSISGFVDSLNSANSSHSLNLGLSRVRSVFMNFMPSTYINNFAYDSQVARNFTDDGGNITPVTEFKTSRAGVLFPCRFNLTSNASQNISNYHINDRRSAMYQSLVNAVKPFYENHYQSGSFKNALDSTQQFFGVVADDTLVAKTQGLGINFSNISNVGVDFSFAPLQFEIVTKNDNAPVNHTIFLFAINRNTLVFEGNNVRVLN